MKVESFWRPRRKKMIVVAPASENTWAVAFSRRLIPGALFTTRAAAIYYAGLLASAAGLDYSSIRILGSV